LIGNEVKIECMCLSLQPREPLVAESGFLMFHAFVHRWLAICEHAGDQTRACVGHGGDGCGRAESSQEAKGVSVFHRLLSRPISAMRVCAVSPAMPAMRVKSTPLMRERSERTSHVGSWRRAASGGVAGSAAWCGCGGAGVRHRLPFSVRGVG